MKIAYEIYQLKDINDTLAIMFHDIEFNLSKYNLIYQGYTEDNGHVESILEDLFLQFNFNHPNDFSGRNLSITDVIKINNKFYMCESIGFKEVKNSNN